MTAYCAHSGKTCDCADWKRNIAKNAYKEPGGPGRDRWGGSFLESDEKPRGAKKTMVCVECGMKIEATITQAKRHGWMVWVGGGQCKVCVETEAERVRNVLLDAVKKHKGTR